MSTSHKLSGTLATLININIMLGAGIFINTVLLNQKVGFFGFAGYVAMGFILLPLIMCMMKLVNIYPSGGFYIFAQKEINPFAGFISAWGYFIGKLASAVLMTHMSMSLIQYTLPIASRFSVITLDITVLALFVALNMLHMKTGALIQALFIIFKSVPVFFVIITGIFWKWDSSSFVAQPLAWSEIPSLIPVFLYAAMGFEAACSISSRIRNAETNAPRVILLSYSIVILILALYQYFFYMHVGSLIGSADFTSAFPALLSSFFPQNPSLALMLTRIFHLAIATSALGGAYGIIFSNNWNLYTLAQHKHVSFSRLFTMMNRFDIPWLCVVAEGGICLLYTLIAQGSQLPLQQLSALGSVIAYTMSVAALINAKRLNRLTSFSWTILGLGAMSCATLLASCVYGLIQKGIASFITFLIFLVIGIIMFVYSQKTKRADTILS